MLPPEFSYFQIGGGGGGGGGIRDFWEGIPPIPPPPKKNIPATLVIKITVNISQLSRSRAITGSVYDQYLELYYSFIIYLKYMLIHRNVTPFFYYCVVKKIQIDQMRYFAKTI
jgi:hypothetical protein